jgi:feruloyl esterase
MEAQKYPADFDGYLVGAPGIEIPRNELNALHVFQALRSVPPHETFTPATLATLSAAVLQRCDSLDGLRDGVVQDPRRCKFDVAALACRSAREADCLTAAQAEAVRKIYDGPRAATGRQLAPGAWGSKGAEAATWPGIYVAPPGAPSLIGLIANKGVINTMVLEQDGPATDLEAAERLLGKVAVMNPLNADLSAARRAGAKILHFHGWADPNISAQYSLDYYDSVQKTASTGTDDFYRLFMVPGLAHCGGGVGAVDMDVGPGLTPDRLYGWTHALERWVEESVAPDQIIATEFARTSGARGFSGPPVVKGTRPLCPYPKVATLNGNADSSKAESFRCARPQP